MKQGRTQRTAGRHVGSMQDFLHHLSASPDVYLHRTKSMFLECARHRHICGISATKSCCTQLQSGISSLFLTPPAVYQQRSAAMKRLRCYRHCCTGTNLLAQQMETSASTALVWACSGRQRKSCILRRSTPPGVPGRALMARILAFSKCVPQSQASTLSSRRLHAASCKATVYLRSCGY